MEVRAAACVLALMVVLADCRAAPKDKTCLDSEKTCSNNSDCCGGCCRDSKCAASAEACAAASVDPCNFHPCPPNRVCYLAPVECLQSRCEPIPACRPDDSDYD